MEALPESCRVVLKNLLGLDALALSRDPDSQGPWLRVSVLVGCYDVPALSRIRVSGAPSLDSPALPLPREGAHLGDPVILRIQHLLSRLGFSPGRLDGDDGPRTRAAVREAQRAAGVQVTGQMDGVTLAALELDLSRLLLTVPTLQADHYRATLPHLPADARPHIQALLVETCATPARAAHLLSQLSHESGGGRYVEEIASGEAYEGRDDLGNTHAGDGRRYKGRGWIQLTGRANYRAAGAYLGTDLEAHPERAADPAIAGRVAAWFWLDKNLNEIADDGDIVGITRRINGGTNGLSDRRARHTAAAAALREGRA